MIGISYCLTFQQALRYLSMRIYLAAHHHLTRSLHERYPDNIGCILQPSKKANMDTDPKIPWVADNGAYQVWRQAKRKNIKFEFEGKPADEFLAFLDWCGECQNKPSFVVCPDHPGNKIETSRLWRDWSPELKRRGFRTAFAAQNHSVEEIPESADLVFIGNGSDRWRLSAIKEFPAHYRIHVGRISGSLIWFCHFGGAVSCDSSGWFRGDRQQLSKLLEYLQAVNLDDEQPEFLQFTAPPFKQLSLFEAL